MEIVGKPLIGHLLDRIKRCHALDKVMVCTTELTEDDILESYCRSIGADCSRGSADDVLGRLVQSFKIVSAEVGVVVYGDCPLIDPALIDEAVYIFLTENRYDFVGNDLKTTYPPGMEVEVFRVEALSDAAERCTDPVIRGHGTLFMRQHPEIYRLHNLEAEGSLCRPKLELEVDTLEDLEVIRNILEHFKGRGDYELRELIEFMDSRGDLMTINKDIERRWKRFRSE